MKFTITTSLVALAFVFAFTLRIGAADSQPAGNVHANELPAYAWSEASEFARVPKSFLSDIAVLLN